MWHCRSELKQLIGFAFLGVAILLAWQSPMWVTRIRNEIFKLEISRDYQKSFLQGHHGISHTLFIGLGSVPNKFGLEYSDSCGAEKVKEISPDTSYCSKEYFDILTRVYFQRLKESPLEVARIYLMKLVMLLKFIPLAASLLVGGIFLLGYLLKLAADWKKIAPLMF